MQFEFTEDQKKALTFIEKNKYIYLTADGGFGKTIVSLTASQKYKTIVLVKSKELAKQWLNYKFEHVTIITFSDAQKLTVTDLKKFESIIIDESHNYCKSTSKRYKMLRKVTNKIKFKQIILLSGTPIRHNEINLYNTLKLFHKDTFGLLKKYPTKAKFTEEFFNFEKKWVFFRDKYEKVPTTLKTGKYKEITNLSNIIHFSMNKFIIKSEYIYFKKKFTDEYDLLSEDHVFRNETFAAGPKLINLMQLTNSTHNEYGKLDNDYLQKINFIKSKSNTFEKIIITYYFAEELKLILNSFENITTDKDEFIENNDIKYYVRQISRSEGADIPICNCIMFFSITYDPVAFQQFKWRITRQSNKHTHLYYYFLIFENTIENRVYEVVEEKVLKTELLKQIGGINED